MKRQWLGVGILLLFHVSGLIGMYTPLKNWFIDLTPLNLLVCLGVLAWNHPEPSRKLLLVAVITGMGGFLVEVAGVNTGVIFGEYRYGSTLGPKLFHTPVLIAVNWILVIEMGIAVAATASSLPAVLQVLIAGTIPVLLDVLIEPTAIRMGWWEWADGLPPLHNYIGWWLTGLGIATARKSLNAFIPNPIAISLLFVQALFFLILLIFPVFA